MRGENFTPKTKIRLRLIIPQNGKLLLMYDSKNDYYFYIGGKLEFGETVKEGCIREIKEECGQDAEFEFRKILYIRDFILPKENEHSLELFILGEINKGKELEGRVDKEFKDKFKWLSWKKIESLPNNLFPKSLTPKLLFDYRIGFKVQGEYLGKIE